MEMEPAVRVLFDGSRPDYRDRRSPRPIRVYEWATPGSEPTPWVLLSHGNGGSGRTMDWLARPLVAAGFRVAAVDHHGNNVVDGYQPEGFLFGWDRPRDLSVVLDDLATVEPLGPVGVAGFSFGGFTALALAGGRIDTDAVAAVLTGRADPPDIPEFPGVLAALMSRMSPAELRAEVERAGLTVETTALLSEEDVADRPTAGLLRDLRAGLADSGPLVVCTHRPVLPLLFRTLGVRNLQLRKGELAALHVRKGRILAVERQLPR